MRIKKGMDRLARFFRSGEKGFTLIELLVVVAILGLLVAILIPNVISFIGEGESESNAEVQHTVQLAVTAACAKLALDGVEVFPLIPGDLDSTGCTARIAAAGNPILDVEPYIIGGYDALKDSVFHIESMGTTLVVTPLF